MEAFWKGCCIQQSLLPDDVPCSSNSLNSNVPITQKPANWFAEQISCLVSIWCQLWRIWVKLLKNTLDLFFYVKDLVTISSNFGPNNIFSLSLNASEFSFSMILTFSLSLINDIKILNLLIYADISTAWSGQAIKLPGPSNIVISDFFSSGFISEFSFDKAFFLPPRMFKSCWVSHK